MTATLVDFITWRPYVWAIVGLILFAGLLALANHYEDNRLPRAREHLDELDARHATRPAPAPIDVTTRKA